MHLHVVWRACERRLKGLDTLCAESGGSIRGVELRSLGRWIAASLTASQEASRPTLRKMSCCAGSGGGAPPRRRWRSIVCKCGCGRWLAAPRSVQPWCVLEWGLQRVGHIGALSR